MKTISTKIVLLTLASGIAFGFSSFKKEEPGSVTPIKKQMSAKIDTDWDQWQEVQEFVDKKISKPVQERAPKRNPKVMAFSRCPSGYHSDFVSDSVLVDRYVYGEINNYTGCNPTQICSFKVNVKKNIALVKGKGDKQYIAVKDWLEKKYGAKEVKG